MKCSITSQLLISKLFLQKPLIVLLWSGQNQSEKSLQRFIRQFFFFEKTLLYCPKYDSSSLNYLYSLNELKKFPLSGKMQILHIFDFVALFTILSRVDAVRLELWPGNHCTVILFFFPFWFVTWWREYHCDTVPKIWKKRKDRVHSRKSRKMD